MAAAGEYLLRVLGAALICTIASEMLGKKGMSTALIRMICGVFLVLTAAAPLANISLDNDWELSTVYQMDAEDAAQQGRLQAQEQYRAVITQQTTAYILDKAESLGLQLEVTVSLTDDLSAAPCHVQLTGRVSPYARKVLSGWLDSELGIAPEEQEWNG